MPPFQKIAAVSVLCLVAGCSAAPQATAMQLRETDASELDWQPNAVRTVETGMASARASITLL